MLNNSDWWNGSWGKSRVEKPERTPTDCQVFSGAVAVVVSCAATVAAARSRPVVHRVNRLRKEFARRQTPLMIRVFNSIDCYSAAR